MQGDPIVLYLHFQPTDFKFLGVIFIYIYMQTYVIDEKDSFPILKRLRLSTFSLI
jgi:hypothetical protein